MIKLQDSTPRVYYNQSRDFQFIGRLYDIVLNSVKTNSDLIYSIPLSDNSDDQFIDLMALTLGFKSKHKYNVRQLTALCNGFCEIIRNKGNRQSITKAINALLRSEGISEEADIVIDTDKYLLTLYIPNTLKDTNLLKDLLTYIVPAGMSCSIISEAKVAQAATTGLELGTISVSYPTTDNYVNSIIPTDEEYVASPKMAGSIGSAVLGLGEIYSKNSTATTQSTETEESTTEETGEQTDGE